MRWLIFIVAFLLGAGAMQFYLARQKPDAPPDTVKKHTQPTPPATNHPSKNGYAAERYVPPPGLNVEMQSFEKAVLFLGERQEADGHWSAKNNGCTPEFQNENGDITLTALATYTLLLTARGKNVNREAVARARKGMEWLQARLQPDGRVALPGQPGEPVVGQLFATMAFLQSAAMSTREEMKKAGTMAARYAMAMRSPDGGWGPDAKAAECRADVSALATFVYRSALLEDVKFADMAPLDPALTSTKEKDDFRMKERQKVRKVEEGIEAAIRDGFKRMASAANDGTYGPSSSNRTPEWDATVAGLLSQVLMLVPPSETQNTVRSIFGELDKTTNRFTSIDKKMDWGEKGANYRSMALWLNTLAVIYLFGEQTFEFKTWGDAAKKNILDRQRRDGGWDVSGEDARRGEIWRAAMHAMAITLIAPAPPPATPEGTSQTEPGKF